MILGYDSLPAVSRSSPHSAPWLLCSAMLLVLSTVATAAQTTTTPSSVPPATVADTVPSYTVHPGDTLDVTFRFTPEFNDEVVVQPDGYVNLKSAGEVRVAGYSLPEIERAILRGSAAKLVNPDVAVTLKDFERPLFVVAGEVQTPGKFELRHATTALQAILLAGGPKEDSAMNHVYLFRRLNADSAEVHLLKLGRYNGNQLAANDIPLQAGDMILVQRDALEKIGRIVKLFNLGVYVNPLQNTIF